MNTTTGSSALAGPCGLNHEALAARGDRASFAELSDHHLRPVHRYLHARLGNRHEAEDVTRAAFERARASRGDTGRLTIAHRALADPYRGPRPPCASPTASRTRARALRRRRCGPIGGTMHALNREPREVIALRFVAGLRYADLARILGRGESAVKMVADRALRQMRERMRDDDR